MISKWRSALLAGGLAWMAAGAAWAGGPCRANDDCGRGSACEDGRCVDCGALGGEVCDDGAFLSHHACGPLVLADLRQGAGPCAGVCGDIALDLTTCNDSNYLSSVCGALEVEAWHDDLAALVVLREGDPEALLPEGETTSECFRITQGQAPESEAAEVRVPSPGENGEGCLDDQGMLVEGCLDDAGEKVPAQREIYGREGQAFVGFDTHYHGLRMQDMTRASSVSPDITSPAFDFVQERAAWDANGDAVSSCAEYVYESYYQFSRFEDAIRLLGNDYWRIWEIAFERTPRPVELAGLFPKNVGRGRLHTGLHLLFDIPEYAIGARDLAGLPVTARNGDPATIQPRLRFLYKPNPWFREGSFSGPVGGVCGIDLYKPTLCDEGLLDAINNLLANEPAETTSSFEWHYRRGVALRAEGVTDEDLDYVQGLADKLSHVRSRRSAALAVVKAILIEMLGGPFDVQTVFEEIEIPVPNIEEIYGNPALLDPGIAAGRAAGATQAARRAEAFRAAPEAFGAQLGRDVVALDRASVLERVLANPLRGFDFGAGGPSPRAMEYSRSGPERSREQARTGGDHLADWRASDLREGPLRQAFPEGYEAQVRRRLGRALAALFAVERELEAVVAEGFEAGCFRVDDGNPCGWTPKMFVELVLELYGEREALYQRCLDFTAEDGFGRLSSRSFAVNLSQDNNPLLTEYPWYNPTPYDGERGGYIGCYVDPAGELVEFDEYLGYYTLGLSVPEAQDDCFLCNNWSQSTTHVTHYFSCIGRWRQLLLKRVEEEVGELFDPEGNLQLLDRVGEWWRVGNSQFGAAAGYGFGWAIGSFQEWVEAVGGDDAARRDRLTCNLAPELFGHFDLGARVFGGNVDIIDASAHLRFGNNPTEFPGGLPRTPDGRPTVEENQIDIEALGQSLYSDNFQAHADGFNFLSETAEIDQDIFSVSAIFTIGFIPVTVSAGLAGFVGMQFDVGGSSPGANQPGNCTLLEVKGSIGPFAGVNAFASASVNAVVAEVGVKIELTLIRLDLPLIGRIALEVKPGSVVQLLADMRLDLIVSLLSGRVLLFLRVAWETWEAELFSWDGPRFSTNLFETSASIPLFDVAEALNSLEDL